MRPQGVVATEVEPLDNFAAAEDYHQQYLERGGRFGRPQSADKQCSDPIRLPNGTRWPDSDAHVVP